MSEWTHVHGIVYVQMNSIYLDINDYLFKRALDEAPKITGSEGSCEIIISKYIETSYLGGYIPCEKCHKLKICKYTNMNSNEKICDLSHFLCDEFKNEELHHTVVYGGVYLTFIGDLRDRTQNTTRKEINDWLKYMRNVYSKRYSVEVLAMKVTGSKESETEKLIRVR